MTFSVTTHFKCEEVKSQSNAMIQFLISGQYKNSKLLTHSQMFFPMGND